ncbi:MAG: DUF2194 domain-containing protein [Lachnospiraceae bacterium]
MLSFKRLLYLLILVLLVSIIFMIYNFNEERGKNITIKNIEITRSKLIENPEIDRQQNEKFIVFGNPDKEIYQDIYRNAVNLLKNLKIDFYQFEEYGIPNITQPEHTLIILCDEVVSDYVDTAWLGDFIEDGGRVIFAAGLSEGNQDSYLWPYLGIREKTIRQNYNKFRFVNEFLPVQSEYLTYGDFSASTWIRISEDSTIYIEDEESEVPLIYSRDAGKGRICMINSTLLNNTLSAGFLTGAIAAVSDDFIYPVIGQRYVYLDNFPMVTFVSNKVTADLYGRDTESFVRDVIWPEFMGIAVRNEIKYVSSVLALSTGEEDFPAINDSLFSTIGKSALQYSGELAYAVNYSEGDTLALNETFLKEFGESFVNYQVQSIVLSGDYFDESILEIPNTAISAVRVDLDEDSYESGFVSKEKYIMLPAVTYGNNLDQGNLLFEYSAIAAYGMTAHVFDINTMITVDGITPSWDIDKDQIGIFEDQLVARTDFLQAKTLSESYDVVNSYANISYEWNADQTRLQLKCSDFNEQQIFFYHTDKQIDSADHLVIESIGNHYYKIEIMAPEAYIYFKEV